MGPTASGKTELGIQLSQSLPIELISVDSTQIYADLNIGSGKLSVEQLKDYPHHLINILSPDQAYSAAEFVKQTRHLIEDIFQRGNIPLLVGGTMLYFKALIEGLHDLPHSDPAVRKELEDLAHQIGWPKMYEKLQAVDPITAQRLDPNDKQRVQRALEVYSLTQKPMSWHLSQSKSDTTAKPLFKFKSFALIPAEAERLVLHQRIERRFDQMLAEGLVDEVIGLRNKYKLHENLPSMRSVGYRQVWSYLQNEIDYDEMRFKAIVATRQLAKRQLTWLRGWADIQNLDFQDKHNLTTVSQIIENT
tara:strand:+ start:27751 stop:28665 length:915 start_codon:yes stop_codon:yes gene_type:complete